MTEQTNESSTLQETPGANTEILEVEALNQLKKQNDILMQQNAELNEAKKKYYDSILNNSVVETNETPEPVDIDSLIIKLKSGELTNREYIETALDIRDAMIEQEGVDPFLASGVKAEIKDTDYATADKVAEQLRQLVNDSNGDDAAFLSLYQSRVVDPNLPNLNQPKKPVLRKK